MPYTVFRKYQNRESRYRISWHSITATIFEFVFTFPSFYKIFHTHNCRVSLITCSTEIKLPQRQAALCLQTSFVRHSAVLSWVIIKPRSMIRPYLYTFITTARMKLFVV